MEVLPFDEHLSELQKGGSGLYFLEVEAVEFGSAVPDFGMVLGLGRELFFGSHEGVRFELHHRLRTRVLEVFQLFRHEKLVFVGVHFQFRRTNRPVQLHP